MKRTKNKNGSMTRLSEMPEKLIDLELWAIHESNKIHKSTPQKTIGRIREIIKTEMKKRSIGVTALSKLSEVDMSIINKFLNPKLTEGNYRDLRVSTLSKFCKTIPQLKQVFIEMFDETEKKEEIIFGVVIEVMNKFKVSLKDYIRRKGSLKDYTRRKVM